MLKKLSNYGNCSTDIDCKKHISNLIKLYRNIKFNIIICQP